MRLVSLCPSITESLAALGLAEDLVGVTRYCIHPSEALAGIPRVGGTKNPDLAAIRAVRPDLVFCNAEENRKEDIVGAEAGIRGRRLAPEDGRGDPGALATFRAADRDRRESGRDFFEGGGGSGARRGGRRGGEGGAAAPLPLRLPHLEGPLDDRRPAHVHRRPAAPCGGLFFHSKKKSDADSPTIRSPPRTRSSRSRPDVLILPDEPYRFRESDASFWRERLPATSRVVLVSGDDFCWHGTRTLRGLERGPKAQERFEPTIETGPLTVEILTIAFSAADLEEPRAAPVLAARAVAGRGPARERRVRGGLDAHARREPVRHLQREWAVLRVGLEALAFPASAGEGDRERAVRRRGSSRRPRSPSARRGRSRLRRRRMPVRPVERDRPVRRLDGERSGEVRSARPGRSRPRPRSRRRGGAVTTRKPVQCSPVGPFDRDAAAGRAEDDLREDGASRGVVVAGRGRARRDRELARVGAADGDAAVPGALEDEPLRVSARESVIVSSPRAVIRSPKCMFTAEQPGPVAPVDRDGALGGGGEGEGEGGDERREGRRHGS